MTYPEVVQDVAAALERRCTGALNVVVLDGIPATGKSALSAAIAAELRASGRSVATVENDWFIARSIRNPIAIAWGVALALSPLSRGTVEERLLARFLDGSRLGAFQDQLDAVRHALHRGESARICPEGAFWNLHDPRPWSSEPAAAGFQLDPGAIVLIEGTLTTTTYAPRFPDLVSVRVRVPPEVARQRFWARNDDPSRRRNRAFSTLALTNTPLRLAEQLLDRHEADIDIDLTCFETPRLRLPIVSAEFA